MVVVACFGNGGGMKQDEVFVLGCNVVSVDSRVRLQTTFDLRQGGREKRFIKIIVCSSLPGL